MDVFSRLSEQFKIDLERDFSFARHTTLGCGGKAAVCASPDSEDALCALLIFLKREGIPYCFLGAGANTLAADGPFDGAVIRFGNMAHISREEDLILAGAGVTGGKLLRFAEENRLGGLEFLAGIPMTVGGATVMNAGVRFGHIGDIIQSVRAVEGGKVRVFSARECRFAEKSSLFMEGLAVTSVRVRGYASAPETIAARKAEMLRLRAHLPKGRSAGCIFVNPPGMSAGKLIDECGLKGARVGGAHVAEEHANFIVNDGGSTSDVGALIDLVKTRVLRERGILLREEVRRLP